MRKNPSHSEPRRIYPAEPTVQKTLGLILDSSSVVKHELHVGKGIDIHS